MNTAGKVLLFGVLAVLIGGCASTEAGRTVSAPGDSSAVGDIPWSGADLQFFNRAITKLEEERESRSGFPDDASNPDPAGTARISLGASTSVREVVFAASFTDWDAGREILVSANILEERAARRLDRVVLRRRGESIAGYLDVDSRRLPAALGLHWSGWERLGFGEWRAPVSQVQVRIPKRGAWVMSRGPIISDPLRETISRDAVARLAAAAGRSEPVEAPMIAWAQGLAIGGIPPQVLPSHLALLVVPADTDADLIAHVVLPFATERDARVAMVVARLVIPRFLQEIGLEPGANFSILREGEELHIVNVRVTHEQLSDGLAQGDIQ